MPAAGVVFSNFTTNQEGVMTVLGTVRKVDTTGFAVNQTAYVASGGGITSARPTGASDLIQNIGRAGRIHASTGTFIVAGAGRVNDVPNIVEARLGISLDAGGITFADGSHQNTAAERGYQYTVIAQPLQTIQVVVSVSLIMYLGLFIPSNYQEPTQTEMILMT